MRKYPKDFVVDVYEGNEKLRFLLGNRGKNTLFCVCINPSSADNEFSDPTMNSLINVSKTKGFDSCIMINPAPYRSNKPSMLPEKPDENLKKNLEVIERLFSENQGQTVLCGWGDYYLNGYKWFKESVDSIIECACRNQMKLVYIRKNRSGQPCHFSYLNYDHEVFNYGLGSYELKEYLPNK